MDSWAGQQTNAPSPMRLDHVCLQLKEKITHQLMMGMWVMFFSLRFCLPYEQTNELPLHDSIFDPVVVYSKDF